MVCTDAHVCVCVCVCVCTRWSGKYSEKCTRLPCLMGSTYTTSLHHICDEACLCVFFISCVYIHTHVRYTQTYITSMHISNRICIIIHGPLPVFSVVVPKTVDSRFATVNYFADLSRENLRDSCVANASLVESGALLIIFEGQMQVFQRFCSSKLVLKTIGSHYAALNYYENGSTSYVLSVRC